MDVVLYEIFAEEEAEFKRLLKKGIQAEYRQDTIQNYSEKEPPAPVISIRTQSVVPDEWLPKVKGILTRSAGFNHLQTLLSRSPYPIPCGHLYEYCARSVAEHALLAILALLKKLKTQLRHFNTFNRNGLTGSECWQRNLLVVGVGKIGAEIVQLGKGVGMNVKGVDIVERDPVLDYVSLEDGIPFADIIVCALPLTEKTEGLLDYAALRRMKRGGLLINISRGEISPLAGIARLLNEGILGGVSLDVYEEEHLLASTLQSGKRLQSEYERLIGTLKDRDDVIFTPHNAFNTNEGLVRKTEQSCEALESFFESGTFPHKVPTPRQMAEQHGNR